MSTIAPPAPAGTKIQPAATQLLRIRMGSGTTYAPPTCSHVQIVFQPGTTTPVAGHGFIVTFDNAELADVNARLLHTGATCLRLRPHGVSDTHLMLLNRFTEPHPCYIEIDVNGTYRTDPATDITEVVADTITAFSLQAKLQ